MEPPSVMQVEWEQRCQRIRDTGLATPKPQVQEFVHLWLQYTPNSFWAQWVASPWTLPIYFIGPDSHSLECTSGNPGKALPPRTETRNFIHFQTRGYI